MSEELAKVKDLLNKFYLSKTELVHRTKPREIVYPRRRRVRELNAGNLAFIEAATSAYGSKKKGDLPPAAEAVAKKLKGLKLVPEAPKPNWELFFEELKELTEKRKAVPVRILVT